MSLDTPPHPLYSADTEVLEIYVHKMGTLTQSENTALLMN